MTSIETTIEFGNMFRLYELTLVFPIRFLNILLPPNVNPRLLISVSVKVKNVWAEIFFAGQRREML